MNPLSDDSGKVDKDWHEASLPEQDAEGCPFVRPIHVSDSSVDWRFLVQSAEVVYWNVNKTDEETPFSVFLQENHSGDDQLYDRGNHWSGVNEASDCFHFTSHGIEREILLVPYLGPIPHESPVEWSDEAVKTEGKL